MNSIFRYTSPLFRKTVAPRRNMHSLRVIKNNFQKPVNNKYDFVPQKFYVGDELIAEKYNVKLVNMTLDKIKITTEGSICVEEGWGCESSVADDVEKAISYIIGRNTERTVERKFSNEINEDTKDEIINRIYSDLVKIGLKIRASDIKTQSKVEANPFVLKFLEFWAFGMAIFICYIFLDAVYQIFFPRDDPRLRYKD